MKNMWKFVALWALILGGLAGCINDNNGVLLPDQGTLPSDMAPEMSAPAEMGADDMGLGDMHDGVQSLALCEGEPANWPPRPRWGDITSGHPEYQDVMNNFNILDSLQLFASMISKAVSGLNTLGNAADDETTGYCICNCTTPTPDWSLMPDAPSQIPTWAMGQMLPATCYADTQTKEQCVDQCDTGSFAPFTNVAEVDSDETYVWSSADTFEKPNGDPRYALKLIKFIDQLTGFLSAGDPCMSTMDCAQNAICDMQSMTCKSELRQVLDALSMAGANLTMEVQMIISTLSQVFAVINRFTEGFHLGGYSTQRPDLHMCVGWAGHGAFSQLANLSSDKLSIGAKYGAHQISYERRVQLRTGGFGVSALGKSLSILPTPEATIQIDGWKVWNADKPFGVPFPTNGVDVNDIDTYDIFDLVDQNQVTDLAGVDGIIQPGELVIVDYYPAAYEVNTNTYEWPRSMNDPMTSPWVPWTGWKNEAESKAVFSAGLNLPLAIEPIEKTLPTIPIFPPYASITPYFSIGAGVEWIHDAFYLRNRIRDKINEGLPSADQLTDANFAREMHDLQAPDVSEDNGTTAYVQPELGATLTFGLQLAKWVSLGINASLGIGAKVEPGGFGGVVDLNYALVQALMESNPPADAPCTPVYDESVSRSCSNENWEASDATYACEGETLGSSCCIAIGSQKACVESWTGIDKEFCELPSSFTAGPTYVDQINDWLDNLRGYAGQSLVNDLATQVTPDAVVSTSWNDQMSCAKAKCSDGLQVPAISSLSECEQFGTCSDADGTVLAHDVSEADCLGYNQKGPGRCCSGRDDRGTYTAISCEQTKASCEDLEGLWVPGGICTSNVEPKDCSNIDDARLGNSQLVWTPYDCVSSIEPEVVGWEGDGCHPLNQGWPSACGCSGAVDCAAGEVCNGEGQCESGAGVTDCVCDPDVAGSCVAGRVCIDGGCAKTCTTDADCPSAFECDQGACIPKHNIPTAESIVWNMQHGDEPIHAISTYAWSEILFLAYSSFSLDIGLSLRIFGKTFEVTVYELAKIWDLGSTNKAWYQPGLEARYQSECADPSTQLVTNRQPNPITAAQGVSIEAIDGFDGYVARYPEPQNNNGTLDPSVEGNACHPGPNQCTWEDLVTWCKEEVPKDVINPDAPAFGDLADGLTDTAEWGEEIGLQLWESGQICIDGEPWYEWSQNANGSLDNLDCIYDASSGPVTFPCGQAPLELLQGFGCLDTGLNPLAQQLATTYGGTITTNGGAQFDAQAMMIDPNGEFAAYNIKPTYLFTGFAPTGILWVQTVESCFETTLEEQSRCTCSVDADCDGDDESCNVDGFCENSASQLTQCPVIQLAAPPDPEPCCGDGIAQDFEECDDGNTVGGDGCSSYCTLSGDDPARGACCYKTEVGLMCQDPVLSTDCQKYEQGTFYSNQTCAQIECP